MDNTCYTYNGKSWRRCPTISDNNSFFHAAFGVRTDESRAYFDEQAEFRRMRCATFLTYFKNQKMPPCLVDSLRKCLSENNNYQHASIDVKQHLTKYISDIMTGTQAVAKEEISILAALENVKVVVLSEGRRDPITVIEPNQNILGSYPKEVPKENPKEVVLCLVANVFARLEPINKEVCPKSNKNKVERKTDPSKYRKGGSAGSKGVEYQVYLLATVILNVLKNELSQWKLSTENEDAGKFDDIVLEWSEGTILIQSKHKESSNKKITLEELTSINSKNDDFSLPKYFLSYMLIKDKFDVKNVIICTNAGVNQKALKFLDHQGDNYESLLHYDGDCSFYTLNYKVLPELIEKTISYYRQNFKNKGIEESIITEENLKHFSKHLQIFFNYPPLETLEKNIEKLLSLTKGCSNSQNKIILLEMLSKVMDWFQQKEGVYFTECHAKAMVAEIWTDKYIQKLERYKVSLQKNDLSFQGPKQIFHVPVSTGYLLQAIKIYQAVQNDKKNTLFVNRDDDIDTQKLILEAFVLPRYVFLIVILHEGIEESGIMEMWDKLSDILDKNKYKKVILITGCNDTFFKHIGPCYEIANGSVKFEDLSTVSQERLLKKENIVFQGRYVCLEELLAARATQDYLKAVDAEILEKIVVGEEVNVGMRPLDLDENIARFYINRTFKRSNEEIDEHNIYDQEDVVLISDSAGMGKSTVLSKLATTIKDGNAHLWVIKIALTDYTGILRDLLINHRETVNIVELLNSKKSTKLTNHLERFVFSMDKRVVLMLDGIDEISPDYTELVLSLLDQCLQTVNFAKLFVTTRPHMVRRLEEVLKVKPFVMHPFTQQNQVNFLTTYWVHNLNIDGENEGKCDRYARTLMNKMSSWTKRHRYDYEIDFTAIPLQLRMLAEIFQESIKQSEPSDWEGCKEYLKETRVEPKLPEKMDIKELYEMFIKRKRDIYVYKGNPSGNTAANGALIKQFDERLVYHKILALEVILYEQDCRLFSNFGQGCDGIDENTLKIGIVQKSNSEIHFIHRTFAEYFVAESLFEELQVQMYKPNVEFQEFFIDEVLHSSSYRIIRIFLDNFLLKAVNIIPSNIFESYQSKISGTRYKLTRMGMYDEYLIHSLAEEGCVAILRLILNCVNFKVIRGNEVDIESAENYGIHKKRNEFKDNSLNILQVFIREGGVNIRNRYSEMPLHYAAKGGHLEMIKFLLEQGAKIDCRSRIGIVPLHYAAEHAHLHIVKFFLQLGADLNISDNHGRTALHFAAERGHLDTVKFLLEQGPNLTAVTDTGMSSLHFAAENGQLDIVKFLLQQGANLNAVDGGGMSALHLAARDGHTDTVEFLLEQGANSNALDHRGVSPLHFAAQNGHLDTIKLLLEQGANLNAADNGGMLVLHLAARDGVMDTVKFLLERGANLNAADRKGTSALHFAVAKRDHLDTVRFLLEQGVSINIRDNDSNTPLHLAASNSQSDIVKLLFELGADFNIRNNDGRTPLHLAASYIQLDIVKYLFQPGADLNSVKSFYDLSINLNTRDNDGLTALHYAALHGHWNTVKFLLELGADFNVRDDKGLTVLHYAAWENRFDTVELLFELGADLLVRDNEGSTALHFAAEYGHLDTTIFLLEQGVHVDVGDNDNSTPLHLAAMTGQLAVVEYLVKLSSDVNFKDSNGRTALHFAAWNGRLDIINFLLKIGADLNIRDIDGLTELHVATINGKFDTAEFLLELGVDFSIENDAGCTPLHLAAANDHLVTLQYLLKLAENFKFEDFIAKNGQLSVVVGSLLETCGDVNIKDDNGRTPLHFAAAKGHVAVVEFLVEVNGDVNITDNNGRTALHLAVSNGRLETVKTLLQLDANINIRDKDGNTAQQLALAEDHPPIVDYFRNISKISQK